MKPLDRLREAAKARLRHLRAIGATSHDLALGIAIGVFVATMPFMGVQTVCAVALAWAMGANMPAAVAGTFWANPVTYPFLWIGSYGIGAWLLGVDDPVTMNGLAASLSDIVRSVPGQDRSSAKVLAILGPLTVGALALGLATGAMVYCGMRGLFERIGRVRRATAPR